MGSAGLQRRCPHGDCHPHLARSADAAITGRPPPAERTMKAPILQKSASLLSDGPISPHRAIAVDHRSAQSTPVIGCGSVDLVVTSEEAHGHYAPRRPQRRHAHRAGDARRETEASHHLTDAAIPQARQPNAIASARPVPLQAERHYRYSDPTQEHPRHATATLRRLPRPTPPGR